MNAFEKLYHERGFDVKCVSDSLKYYINGLVYRSIKCDRYDYRRNVRMVSGYLVEDAAGKTRIYSIKHFEII